MTTPKTRTPIGDNGGNKSLDFGARDVKCPSCGDFDNHCAHRRGLCCWCYCCLTNSLPKGDADFFALDYGDMVAKAKSARMAAIKKGLAEPTAAMKMAEVRKDHTPAEVHKLDRALSYNRAAAARKKAIDVVAKYGVGFKGAADYVAPSAQAENVQDENVQDEDAKRKWRERSRAYYASHLEEKRAYFREWRRKNHAKWAAITRRYRERHREKIREANRKWRKMNPEKYIASKRKSQAARKAARGSGN